MAKKNRVPKFEKRTHFANRHDFITYLRNYGNYIRKYQDRFNTFIRLYHLNKINKLVKIAKKRGWYNA